MTVSPKRPTSSAESCSTSTLVRLPRISMIGRTVASRATVDVGATNTTERGNRTSDWTTTPNRRPRCSFPTPFGKRSSTTSPLRTERLHELGDFQHLSSVLFVRLKCGHLLAKYFAPPLLLGALHERRPLIASGAHERPDMPPSWRKRHSALRHRVELKWQSSWVNCITICTYTVRPSISSMVGHHLCFK